MIECDTLCHHVMEGSVLGEIWGGGQDNFTSLFPQDFLITGFFSSTNQLRMLSTMACSSFSFLISKL